jgi:DNA-binding MurR/RpiR family transcriptional regulator
MSKRLSGDQTKGCLLRIRSRYNSLRQSERKVADYVLAHAEEVIRLSVTEVGRRAGVSDAAVVRFSQTLGYPGFWGLKIAVAGDVAVQTRAGLEEQAVDGSVASVKASVFRESLQALSETETLLEETALERAVTALCRSERLLFLGVGASGLVATDAAYKFSRIGLNATSYLDAHMQAAIAATLTPKDLAFAISHSGDTKLVVTALELAKEAGAQTACITNYAGSAITRVADITLLTASKETIFRTSATSSRIAQLSVLDTLYTLTVLARREATPRNLDRARTAVAVLEK